jgi:hypothetical protein
VTHLRLDFLSIFLFVPVACAAAARLDFFSAVAGFSGALISNARSTRV